MNKTKKLLALFLALVMCVGLFAGCNNGNNNAATSDPGTSNPPEEKDTTLVVADDAFDGKFSPFFYTAVPDEDVINQIFLGTMGLDREGAPVLKGIQGETRTYNGTDYTYTGIADWEVVENPDGTVDYNMTMRDDINYTNGDHADIDDVIFAMYVLCDPTYDGSSTFSALPIEGLDAYTDGMENKLELMLKLGRDNTNFSYWDEAEQTAFWSEYDAAADAFIQGIIDYLVEAGANTAEDDLSLMAPNWGYELPEGATKLDWFEAMRAEYKTLTEMVNAELGNVAYTDVMPNYDKYNVGVQTGESAPNITGIKRTGDYSMTIHLTEVDATAILQMGQTLVPRNYYGDGNYDYDNNYFGFPKGDLSVVKSKTTAPVGAGPYIFHDFSNNVVTLDANPDYYKGEPKIKHLNFQVVLEADKVTALTAGTVDLASPSFSDSVRKEIADANGSEDFDGSVITVKTTQYLGYGYIGINAKNVSVGGDRGSDASKNLRKAIATVLAVYRDEAIASYYGEWANVINYPLSDTSWAAPRVTDEGYKVAFSTDVNGDPIYTEGMTNEEKYAAALDAALGYFEAAGYTVEDGKLTAAPEGASMEYELIIPAGGTGEHPNFMIVTNASEALKSIGFNLIITDVSDGTVTIGNNLDAGTAELWTMAWNATPDPDMYQIYFSGQFNPGMKPGGSSNYYGIQDEELDQLILEARASLDQNYRKVLYHEALDIVVDWATEIPVYQRTDLTILSTERVNVSTLTPDMTPYWGWANDIELLEMN